MDLATYLKQHRISVYRLAKLSGVSPRTLWRVVRGQVEPRAQTARQICNALGEAGAPLHVCQLRGCACPSAAAGGAS